MHNICQRHSKQAHNYDDRMDGIAKRGKKDIFQFIKITKVIRE